MGLIGLCNNASSSLCSDLEYFCFRNILLDSGRIPLLMWLVNNRNAPFTFLFCMKRLSLNEILPMFVIVLVDGKLSSMVLLSLEF